MTNNNAINNKPDANRTAKAIAIYGTSGALTEIGPLTDGQLIIGNTGNNPTAAVLASAGGTITITNGAGTIDLKSTALVAGTSGFFAYKNGDTANSTGDGTTVTLACGTEVYDIASDYDTGTFTFTAPTTGKYYVHSGVFTVGMGNGHTYWQLTLLTSNRNYYHSILSPGPNRASPSGGYTGNGGDITDMDAADTFYSTLQISNSTKTVGINGGQGYTNVCAMRIF